MKTISVPETQMMSTTMVDDDEIDTMVNLEVPDSLDETIFNRYLSMVRKKDQHLDEINVGFLIKALVRAEANKHDINSLLLVALLAGKRQVIYEHHLKKQ